MIGRIALYSGASLTLLGTLLVFSRDPIDGLIATVIGLASVKIGNQLLKRDW